MENPEEIEQKTLSPSTIILSKSSTWVCAQVEDYCKLQFHVNLLLSLLFHATHVCFFKFLKIGHDFTGFNLNSHEWMTSLNDFAGRMLQKSG